jgi:DNA-directed RNA polymerase subunit RPC12/RpoP
MEEYLMAKIELKSKGVFCPHCGSKMKQFGPKSRKQYKCIEDPEHYATDNTIKTIRKVILE